MAKRPERTARTQEDLKQAFWVLYSEKPLEKITVGEVCARAGYNRGTFYLHYADLGALLKSMEDEILAGITECVETCMVRLQADSGKLACLAACKDVVLFYERNKPYLAVLLGRGGDPAFAYQLKEALKPLWRQYVLQPDAGKSEEEVDFQLEYTLSGTLFMVSRWLSNPGATTAPQMAHMVYDFSIKDARTRA